MAVIATSASVHPTSPVNAMAADAALGDPAAGLLSDAIFSSLLAKQLGVGMMASQVPGMADAKLDAKLLKESDSVDADAAALESQLQMVLGIQADASAAAGAQAVAPQAVATQAPVMPVANQVAELAQDGAAAQKVGETSLPVRQGVAATGSDVAATKPSLSADGKGDEVPGFSQAIAAAVEGKPEQLPAPELMAAKHGGLTVEKAQPAAVDTQSVVTTVQSAPSQQPPSAVQSAALPSAAIQEAVTSPSWGAGLGDKVVWMVGQNHQGVELHLNPPALGPLEVRVSMSDGQANLSFMTQHAPVREAIESATSRLREMLGDSGISMGSVSVNVGTFAQQQQQQSNANQEGGRSASTPWMMDNDVVVAATAPVVTMRSLHGNGMVDTFA